MSPPIWARSVFRVFVGLPSAQLLRIVHNIGFCCLHFFVQVEIEDVVFDVDWNELFSSVRTHLSFEVYRHFLANFAAHWNHETIVGSQIEMSMSVARDFSRTPVSLPFRYRHKPFSS